MRDYPQFEDLGLVDDDRTEDLRPKRATARCSNTRPSEPTLTKTIGDSIMTRNPSPVDSAEWRDYADQLPASVVASFARSEELARTSAHLAFPGEDPEEVLRKVQRHILKEAREQLPFVDIELPAGCDHADTWQDDGTGTWTRSVIGPRRTVDHLSIGVDGVQRADGSVAWQMFANVDDDPLTPEQARAFAEMLVLTAAEFEVLTNAPSNVDTSRNW